MSGECGESAETEALQMTDVTIRGIDDEVYSKFAAEAKKNGKAIGELTTEVMREYVEREIPKPYKICNIDNLPVTKIDLESMDGKVIFQNIDVLEFMEDVDWATVKERVERIENVDRIIIPKGLSKFQILSKAKNIDTVETK
ncbi:MAG: hypothetical protein A4E32_00972 [Methanomassiliicoccales archaeon PtaU1.Bin124]|nr:MAG: hypothetical protein A4E32_00972 [Methanomassiliicoccales archaeon PtaU1.Bin124]